MKTHVKLLKMLKDTKGDAEMTKNVKIKKISPKAKIPLRTTEGSAGTDLFACIDEPITIKHGELIKVPTGIAIELDDSSLAAFVFARSGLGIKHGISLSNGVGVIDSDYRGEICVGLCNLSDVPYTIQPQERIAQLVLLPVICANFVETDDLSSTERGKNGFGSTGRE